MLYEQWYVSDGQLESSVNYITLSQGRKQLFIHEATSLEIHYNVLGIFDIGHSKLLILADKSKLSDRAQVLRIILLGSRNYSVFISTEVHVNSEDLL